MFGENEPYSTKGHDVKGLENPKAVGSRTATGNVYPTVNMEHRQRATIDTMPDRMEVVCQLDDHASHREGDVPYTGKSQSDTAQHELSTRLNHTKVPVPRQGIIPLYPPLQHTSGIYSPLHRWEQETFKEQPWHGLARESLVDSSSNGRAGDCENKEDIASKLCTEERGRDAAKVTAQKDRLHS